MMTRRMRGRRRKGEGGGEGGNHVNDSEIIAYLDAEVQYTSQNYFLSPTRPFVLAFRWTICLAVAISTPPFGPLFALSTHPPLRLHLIFFFLSVVFPIAPPSSPRRDIIPRPRTVTPLPYCVFPPLRLRPTAKHCHPTALLWLRPSAKHCHPATLLCLRPTATPLRRKATNEQ